MARLLPTLLLLQLYRAPVLLALAGLGLQTRSIDHRLVRWLLP